MSQPSPLRASDAPQPTPTRRLYQRILSYGEFDRMPVLHWGPWDETRQRWLGEGLPPDANDHAYFRAIPPFFWVLGNLNLYPAFEEKVFEETDEYRIYRDSGGVIQKHWKHKSSIPHFMDFTLKSAADWEQYKKRLQPCAQRLPADLDQQIARSERSNAIVAIHGASLMGWIRNWMGVENMCYLMYDAPDVYADMVDTLAELTCWFFDQAIPRFRIKPDGGYLWEDICGRSGPLVSPEIFDRCVAPGYRKIRSKLESYGINLLAIDCDGFIEPLLPHWLDAGVNVHFPIEIGAWQADPMDLRRKFGRELRMVGGINKLALEKGRGAIDQEIERRMPIMRDGGFVPMPDHLITPGTSLADYQYYLDRIRGLRL